MANSLLPPEERDLTPDQVEALDKRRDLGHTLLVIAGQFAVIATILLLWVGQDLAWSPGWAHPIAYYFALALAVCMNVEESRAEARGARQGSRVRAAGQSHLDRCREGANQIAENICQERPACNRVFTHFPKHIPFISCLHFKCDCPGCGQGWRRALQQGASANTPAIDSMPSRGAGESPLLQK